MNKILDKVMIFTLCLIFYLPNVRGVPPVVPVLAAVAAGSLLSFFERRILTLSVFAAFCVLSVFLPGFFFFLPLLGYDVFACGPSWAVLLAGAPAAAQFASPGLGGKSPFVAAVTALILLLAFLTQRRGDALEKQRAEYACLRDRTREAALQLEAKNRALMEKQDYEVRIATLNERNRIAREIHDSVGHLLSSAILQIGAMLATCRDPALRESLSTLNATLARGMDSIRSSIHGLYDESIDLRTEVEKLTDGFAFCPLTLRYDVAGSPKSEIKYTLIAVLKEALSNIIRHSGATRVRVTVREHPGFYQMIVRDNGAAPPAGDPPPDGGIGLRSIRSRVEGLHGHFAVQVSDGFELFISIPKEETE